MRAVMVLVAIVSLAGCRRPPAPSSTPARQSAERPSVASPQVPTVTPDATNAAPKLSTPPFVAVDAPPVFPPVTWTHKELAEHLRGKGLKVVVESVPQYSTDGKVAAGFYEESSSGTTLSMALVYACRDTKAAADQAGALGDGAVKFGRFAIGLFPKPDDKKADLDYLRRISKALN